MDLLIFILIVCIFFGLLYTLIHKQSESYMNLNMLEKFQSNILYPDSTILYPELNITSSNFYDLPNNIYNEESTLENQTITTSNSNPNSNPSTTSNITSNTTKEPTIKDTKNSIANFELKNITLDVTELINRGMASDYEFKYKYQLLYKDNLKLLY